MRSYRILPDKLSKLTVEQKPIKGTHAQIIAFNGNKGLGGESYLTRLMLERKSSQQKERNQNERHYQKISTLPLGGRSHNYTCSDSSSRLLQGWPARRGVHLRDGIVRLRLSDRDDGRDAGSAHGRSSAKLRGHGSADQPAREDAALRRSRLQECRADQPQLA